YDLERLSAKISSSRANPRDLAQLRNSLQQIPLIFYALKNCVLPELQKFIDSSDLLEDVHLLLENALVYDPPSTLKEGGIFKPKFDDVLDELVNLSMGGRDQIAAIEQREKELTGIPSLKIKYTRVFGYYIEITKTHLAKVPEHYRRKQTVAAGERYVTPELIILEEQVATCEVRRQNKEAELFENLRQNLNQQAARLLKSAKIIAQLDVLASFAEVADRQRYIRPKLLPMSNRQMQIVEGRHPVVEVLANKRKNTFVPNNTEMNTDTNRLLLITGPNMAGKSTIMRQVALIQLMAQAGSFVPAKSAVLSLCDRIFTRVGASDDLIEGRSTFMVEMTETAHILNHATGSSLVVLDEIGRGTSTYDGLSLAFAVAEYLHDVVKARTLFATHYHELVWLTKSLSGVKNMQVAVQETNSNISFLYRLIDGAAEQSYGIHVARLAGLPKTVLQRAENILHSLESEAKPTEINIADSKHVDKIPQLNLFNQALFDNNNVRQLVDLIDKVDVNQTTPLEALNQLVQIKNIAKTV
ncbi:MAG: DNA mismatch repair protein MutS, partial [bacterium]|nr:DNA mismatch repair protein MutS [bacterium]